MGFKQNYDLFGNKNAARQLLTLSEIRTFVWEQRCDGGQGMGKNTRRRLKRHTIVRNGLKARKRSLWIAFLKSVSDSCILVYALNPANVVVAWYPTR